MANSYLTNIHTKKIITENVIFQICTCQNMYSKKKYVHMRLVRPKTEHFLTLLDLAWAYHLEKADF